jgi:putative ABC transport system ATP-binding protein
MIQLNEVTKVFNQGRPNEFRAVDSVTLTIEPNRITVLRGPSGSGKTTLLAMIGCLARPTSGRILLHGRNLSGLPERFLTGVRRETFGFTFQRFNLIQGLSVLDNVMLPAYPLAPDHGDLVTRARALLSQFGLDSRLSREFMAICEGLRAAGRTLILSSHDAEVFEAPCVDRVVTLHDGAVVEA